MEEGENRLKTYAIKYWEGTVARPRENGIDEYIPNHDPLWEYLTPAAEIIRRRKFH